MPAPSSTRFEAVDLGELLLESVDVQKHSFGDAGLELEVDVQRSARVRGDTRRLGQLVDNLLANSRRYTRSARRVCVLRSTCDQGHASRW